MRSDLLSKRLYYVGWFGLPWLWIVHVLYHWNVVIPEEESTPTNPTTTNNNTPVRLEQDDNILNINPDDHFHDEPTTMTTEQIHIEAMKWVNRCKVSAFIVVLGWIAWIIIAQVLRDQLPVSLYVLPSDSQQITGW